MSSKTNMLAKLLIAILAPAALLLCIESGLRVIGRRSSSFLLQRKVGDQSYWIENEFAARRFFGQAPIRKPVWTLVPVQKDAAEKRIVILGESAALGDPAPEFGLARQLEVLLQEANTNRKITVVNAAMTAINSHVIKDIARDCLVLDPDAFVLMAGNNEFIGPYGPASILAPFFASDWLIALHKWVNKLALSQVIRDVFYPPQTIEWGGLNAFSTVAIPPGDQRIRITYNRFQYNVLDIIDLCQKKGIPIAVLTVPVNLSGCPPFLSDSNGAYNAQSQFDAGVALEAAGDSANALKHYSQARDWDALHFRTDSEMNRILRQIEGATCLPIDAESRFVEHLGGGAPGDSMFLDHVHFNFRATSLLAAQIAADLAPKIGLKWDSSLDSYSVAKERLAFTIWDDYRINRVMYQRLRGPPYNRWSDHANRIAKLEAKLKAMESSISPKTLEEAEKIYERAIARRPGDWVLHEKAAMLAISRGEAAAAVSRIVHSRALAGRETPVLDETLTEEEKIARLVTLRSERPAMAADALFELGHARLQANEPEAALPLLAEAVGINPHLDSGWVDLGVAQARLDQFGAARQSFERALEIRPKQISALHNLAALELRLGRMEAARARLHQALDLEPTYAPSLSLLATTCRSPADDRDLLQRLDRALHVASRDATIRSIKATHLLKTGRTREGEQALADLAADLPESAVTELVHDLMEQDLAAHAVYVLEQRLRAHPQDAIAMSNLAWLLGCAEASSIRDMARAAALAEQAASLRPNDVNLLYTWAAVSRASGNWDQALRIAEQAMQQPIDPVQRRLWSALKASLLHPSH